MHDTLERQAISNGTEKLHVLQIDFIIIHTEGILTLPCIKIHVLLAHWMIWNLKLAHNYQKVTDPCFK